MAVVKYNSREALTNLANELKKIIAAGGSYNTADVVDILGIKGKNPKEAGKVARMKQRLVRIIELGIATPEEILPKGITYDPKGLTDKEKIKKDPKFLSQQDFVKKLGFTAGKDDREKVTRYKETLKNYPKLYEKYIDTKPYGFISGKPGEYRTKVLYANPDKESLENFKKELKEARPITKEENNKILQKIANYIKKTNIPVGARINSPFVKNMANRFNLSTIGLVDKLAILQSQVKNPDRGLDLKGIEQKISRLPTQKYVKNILASQGFSKKTIDKLDDVSRAASFVSKSATNFEHRLPQLLINIFNLGKKYLLKGERTSEFLNQFKKQYDKKISDQANKFVKGEINYTQYKSNIKKIRDLVSKLTGGYQIGYVDFDKNGKAIPVGASGSLLKTKQGDLGIRTTGLINFFKNAQYHNELYKNYKKNPNLKLPKVLGGESAFGTLKAAEKKSKFKFEPEPELEKTYKIIQKFKSPKQFIKLFEKDPDNPFFKGIVKGFGRLGQKGKLLFTPAGRRTLGTAGIFALLTSALKAEETDQNQITPVTDLTGQTREQQIEAQYQIPSLRFDEYDTSTYPSNPEVKSQLANIPMTAGFVTGLTKAPEGYKEARALGRGRVRSTIGLGGGLGKTLAVSGTPLFVGGFEIARAIDKLKEGQSISEILAPRLSEEEKEKFFKEETGLGEKVMTTGLNIIDTPAFGVSLMEPLTKASGAAKPGLFNKILRAGLSPRAIAGATRFLGLPGLAISTGLTAYDLYNTYKQSKKSQGIDE